MSEQNKTLYERLGGYDAIAAVPNDLVARLNKDPQLGRFWAHRGEDGIKREQQLLIDFLCESADRPEYRRVWLFCVFEPDDVDANVVGTAQQVAIHGRSR